MDFKFIDRIEIKDKIVCSEQLFSVGYCNELQMYLMEVVFPYIAWYNQYYAISEEDYALIKNGNTDEYLVRHKNELGTRKSPLGYGETFLGSQSFKRDYLLSVPPDEAKGFIWIHGALFMCIKYKEKKYAVAPGRTICDSNGEFISYEFCNREKYPDIVEIKSIDDNGKECSILCGIPL